MRRVAGASAGSLIAAYYLMDLPLDKCLKEIIEMTEYARSLPLGVFDRSNQIVDVLPQALDRMFPEDAHKRVSGRLYVSMTRLKDLKSVVVNEFETRQDLIDVSRRNYLERFGAARELFEARPCEIACCWRPISLFVEYCR